jgi:hypothetical protein
MSPTLQLGCEITRRYQAAGVFYTFALRLYLRPNVDMFLDSEIIPKCITLRTDA